MTTAYSIKGGRAGRERLRVLNNIRQRGTLDFLDGIGVRPGMSCLDVGCGGGDVAREFARRIGVTGQVLGLDMDQAPKMRSGNADFYSPKACCFSPYAPLCLPPPTVFANQG